MAGIPKPDLDNHYRAMDLIHSDKELSFDEKLYILQYFREDMNTAYTKIGAFFTPMDMAIEFAMCVASKSAIELCAGIGVLSFFTYHHNHCKNLTCVEYNREYVEVGKRVLPEANWICGSILDQELMLSLGRFTTAFGNPPFGVIKTGLPEKNWLSYTGNEFEYKAIVVGSHIAQCGMFILPQMSAGFKQSGTNQFEHNHTVKYNKFVSESELELYCALATDLSIYKNDWKNTKIICEFVSVEY